MTKKEVSENITAIADHYGFTLQSRQLVEEMAELTKAICKFWRRCSEEDLGYAGVLEYMDMIDELADVKIMVEQVEHLAKGNYYVREKIKQKVARQIRRIEAEQEKGPGNGKDDR